MFVRPAKVEDAHRIAEIHVSSWRAAYRNIVPQAYLDNLSIEDRRQKWIRRLANPPHNIHVAEDHDRVLGWIDFGLSRDPDLPNIGEIYAIYLDPDQYRRGLGRLLWHVSIQALAGQGHPSALVWVFKDNMPARKFYEAMGGQLDAKAVHFLELAGARLPEIRYVCPTRLDQPPLSSTDVTNPVSK